MSCNTLRKGVLAQLSLQQRPLAIPQSKLLLTVVTIHEAGYVRMKILNLTLSESNPSFLPPSCASKQMLGVWCVWGCITHYNAPPLTLYMC